MFHAISACLPRLVRRIESRLAIPDEYAAWYGWETRQVSPRTREYRDPRFGRLADARTVPAAEPGTWAHAALTGRIRALSVDTGTWAELGRDA